MIYEAEEAMVAEESRMMFTLEGDDDERDPPESRDDSQPLDMLTMELTALKMGQDSISVNHHLHYNQSPKRIKREGNSFDRIRSARDTLLAEMEVRKIEKTGIFFQSTRRTPPTTAVEEPQPGYIGGTEENPIPATKSLDFPRDTAEKLHQRAIKATTENVYSPSKAVTTASTSSKQAPDKRPPLPPRTRPPTRQKVKPLAPMLKTIDSSNRFKRNTGPRDNIDTRSTSEQNNYHELIIIGSEDENNFKNYQEPVLIHLENADSRDLSESAYREHLNEKNGKEFNTSVSSNISSSTSTSIDTLVAARPEQSERIVSPCQHSSIVKSAYALDTTTQGNSSWPEELTVSSNLPIPVTSGSPHSTGDHIDLIQMESEELETQCNKNKTECTHFGVGQMDPDELEAEYVRLVTTKRDSVMRGSAEKLAVFNIVTHSKRKPLDEIRKLSVVSEVDSIDDQDTQKALANRAVQEVYSREDKAALQITKKVGEAKDVVGTDPPQMDPKNASVGHVHTLETTQASHVIFVRDVSMDEKAVPQVNEPHIAYENDDDSTTSDEQDQYIFLSKAAGNSKQESTSIKIEYDFSSVERVVADYFDGKPKLAEEVADSATSKFKRNLFNSMNIGGCCVGFSP